MNPRLKTPTISKETETRDRELMHEAIDELRLLAIRCRANADAAQDTGTRVALSSLAFQCDSGMKSLQHALQLSFPDSRNRFEELTEEAIDERSGNHDNWRPGDTVPSED